MSKRRPPCPDPDNYIWVESKEGGHWRKKRGTVAKAKLNSSYKQSNKSLTFCSPAASRIVKKLKPFLSRMKPGRLTSRITGKLVQTYNEKGELDFSNLQDFEFQSYHPLTYLLRAPLTITIAQDSLSIHIPIHKGTVQSYGRLITDYYFEMILLHGDPSIDNGLRIESDDSDAYPIGVDINKECRLSVLLPSHHWMVLLKVNCIEGTEMAYSNKAYALKVIAVG